MKKRKREEEERDRGDLTQGKARKERRKRRGCGKNAFTLTTKFGYVANYYRELSEGSGMECVAVAHAPPLATYRVTL